VLSGWLHRTAQNIAAQTVRTIERRRAREQEAAVMNQLLSAASDTTWEQIAPQLDAALAELTEPDRDALLLRYFERKSAREMAQVLGVSDEAAQKRVNRAVERLREFFAKRGVTVGASGLVLLISANAVQAAPVGLVVTISTATAAFTGTTVAVSATATATKTMVMTTLQKTIIAATIAVALSAGIYQGRQVSHLTEQNQSIQRRQTQLAGLVQELQRAHDTATNRLAVLSEENAQLKSGQQLTELLKLRGQVGLLRKSLSSVTNPPSTISILLNDPVFKEIVHQKQLEDIKERYDTLFEELKLTPEQIEKFTELHGELWMKGSELGSNADDEAAQQAVIKAKEELEKQLKSMLGEAGYARYDEFNDEIPARAAISQLEDELEEHSLTDEQSARLLAIVKAEPREATHGMAGELDKAFFGSQEDVDEHFRKVVASHQRILEQAASFLTPEQLTTLSTVQSNSVIAQKIQGAVLTHKH
jgi:hypothetical protein